MSLEMIVLHIRSRSSVDKAPARCLGDDGFDSRRGHFSSHARDISSPSSETQGQLVGAKRSKPGRNRSGESFYKSDKSPWGNLCTQCFITLRIIFSLGRDPLAGLNHWKDINAVAGLLRVYFRELEDPLFSSSHYQEFIKASREYQINNMCS